jgi:hypothetical protein
MPRLPQPLPQRGSLLYQTFGKLQQSIDDIGGGIGNGLGIAKAIDDLTRYTTEQLKRIADNPADITIKAAIDDLAKVDKEQLEAVTKELKRIADKLEKDDDGWDKDQYAREVLDLVARGVRADLRFNQNHGLAAILLGAGFKNLADVAAIPGAITDAAAQLLVAIRAKDPRAPVTPALAARIVAAARAI